MRWWCAAGLLLVGACGDNTGAVLDARADVVDSWTFGGWPASAPFPAGTRVWLGGTNLRIADPTTEAVVATPDLHDIIDLAVHDGYGWAIAGSPPAAYRVSNGGLDRIAEARALDIGGDVLWLATDTGVIELDLVSHAAGSLELGPQRDIVADENGAWSLGVDGDVHQLTGSPLTAVESTIRTNGLRLALGDGTLSAVGFKQVCHSTQCWQDFGVERFATSDQALDPLSEALLPAEMMEYVGVALHGAGGVWAVGAGVDFDSVTLFSNIAPDFQPLMCSAATKTATEIIAACFGSFAHYSLLDGSRVFVNTALTSYTDSPGAIAWEP